MNFTNLNDLADELGCTRDDINNALKRYVHPDCVPETAPGQLRMFGYGNAMLLAFAIAARHAGYFPEQVRGMTRAVLRDIHSRKVAMAVIIDGTDGAACTLLPAGEIDPRAWWQSGAASLRIIDLAPLQQKVDAAITKTAARYGDVPRKVEAGWGGDAGKKATEIAKAKARAAAN